MYSEVLQKLLGESGAVAASIADYSSGLTPAVNSVQLNLGDFSYAA